MKKLNHVTSYMQKAFKTPQEIFDDAFEILAPRDDSYDTMVGSGLSGALILPVLAREFGKNWALVRKDAQKSHTGSMLEGVIGERWIFVDDFIDSGATLRHVQGSVNEVVRTYNEGDYVTEFVGTYGYHRNEWWPANHRTGFYDPTRCPCETCVSIVAQRTYAYR